MTAGADAPQGFNIFGWGSYHINGLFSATAIVPDGVIRTAGIDTALSNVYNNAPDTVKQTVSNTAQKYNEWEQNNPNLSEVGKFGINVGASVVGVKAGLPKGVGGDGVGGAVPPVGKNKTPKQSENQNQEHNSYSNKVDLVPYNPHEAVKSSLNGDRIDINILKAMIPNDTPNTFVPSAAIADGYKYSFDVNGTKVEIKWHSPDANAAQKYPNSNSGREWTAQIKVGNKLLGGDGKFYRKPSNITHIPLTK